MILLRHTNPTGFRIDPIGIKFVGSGGWAYSTTKLKNITSGLIIQARCQGFTMSNFIIEGNFTNIGLELKRNDTPNESLDIYNDVDYDISHCTFFSPHTGIVSYGRHIGVFDNSFSQTYNGIILDNLNTTGNYGGPARAIKISRNQFHANKPPNNDYTMYSSIYVRSKSIYGVSIQNNFQDAFGTFVRGYLVDAAVSNNMVYQLVGYGIYADSIANCQILGNNFIQSQKYTDGTNLFPPYVAAGGIFCAKQIINTNIADNIFPPTKRNVIKFSQGARGVNIRGNFFSRWGAHTTGITSAIQLDTVTSVNKSQNVIVESNKLSQSYTLNSYGVESHSFDYSIIVDRNQVITSNNSVVTELYFPNLFPRAAFAVRRNLLANENINTLTADVCMTSGVYVVSSNTLAATLTGLPLATAGILEVIAVSGSNSYRTYRIIRSTGQRIFYQNISGGLISSWVELTPVNASTSVKGVVNQMPAQSNSAAGDLTTLVSDFNALLLKMRTAGLLSN